MKVLHLNTHDYGGASKAAYRLHRALSQQGHDSRFLVKKRTRIDTDAFAYDNAVSINPNLLQRVRNKLLTSFRSILARRDPKYFFVDSKKTTSLDLDRVLETVGFNPDVIVAHWISDFFDAEALFYLSERTGAPIFWYLMDMAPFTGGCHYAWDCRGYEESCGKCPALYSRREHDLSNEVWRRKKSFLEKTRLVVVAASEWNYRQAKRASVFSGKEIEKVLLGVDPELFSPGNRTSVRKEMELPIDKKILFFGAYSLTEERKGMAYLAEALAILEKDPSIESDKVCIVFAGEPAEWRDRIRGRFEYRNVPYFQSESALSRMYQAADGFICPSIEDSGPMMINESMMCGTPVVSFEMGVAPDLVHSEKTGYRARLRDGADLAYGMRLLLTLSEEDAKIYSNECRRLALELSHPRIQAEKFQRLFQAELAREK